MATHRIDATGHIIPVAEHERRRVAIRELRNSRAWREARAEAIRRQPYCSRCGATERLEGHHRTDITRGGPPLSQANIEVLCRGCHAKH